MTQILQRLKIHQSAHRQIVKRIHRKTHWRGIRGNLFVKIHVDLILNFYNNLPRQAVNEIVRDSEKASKLIKEFGPSSCHRSHPNYNKRFLTNTVRSVINHNKRTTHKNVVESKRKFEEISKRKPKFGHRIHSFQRVEERKTINDSSKKWFGCQCQLMINLRHNTFKWNFMLNKNWKKKTILNRFI